MKKTAGYVIISGMHERSIVKLGDDGLLWHGSTATLFKDYEAARNALRRTTRYTKKHNLHHWNMSGWRIWRVKEK